MSNRHFFFDKDFVYPIYVMLSLSDSYKQASFRVWTGPDAKVKVPRSAVIDVFDSLTDAGSWYFCVYRVLECA